MMTLILLINSIARQISDVVAVSGFLSTVGSDAILVVWLVDMFIVMLVTAIQSVVIDKYNRLQLLSWMVFSFALIHILLRFLFIFEGVRGINYGLLFLLSEQQQLFFPIIFWVLANDIFSMTQSKRLFPPIASGEFVGQILGLGISGIAPILLTRVDLKTEELLVFNGLLYMIIFIFIKAGLHGVEIRRTSNKKETFQESLSEGWEFIKEIPAFRYIMFSIIGINVVLTIFEFDFLGITNQAFPTVESYQQFYSLFRLGLILSATFIQTFLTSRILQVLNLKNALLILPINQLFASLWMILSRGLVSGIGGFSLSKISQLTINEAAGKSIQSLVPEERRGRVSLFMDSYLFAIGTIMGCVILTLIWGSSFFIETVDHRQIYLILAAVVGVANVGFVLKMRSTYDSSLLNWRLKRRQKGRSVLDQLDF
ncbi:hypothetical protein L1047_14260 [Synechococcus sp. Nb3U1]|uniref:hypothetical protein n=1 Tax=Synechococcus sp. Nb3U1 TaxID=1914529 RepID=UPI001F1D6BEB|nr:hypothetical protein [Synechococcus sp. Nb3U1]MCF2972358.1 hypothetical protein [Synechococcus sp. Nb3U1]